MALQPRVNKPLKPNPEKVAPNEEAQEIEQKEEVLPKVMKEPTLAELNAFQRKLNQRLDNERT